MISLNPLATTRTGVRIGVLDRVRLERLAPGQRRHFC
jgi:hypothetical protein